jgi:D-3-phosphoglycerate dehydrogenase
MSDSRRPLVVVSDPSVHPEAIARLSESCELRILGAYTPEERYAEACVEAQAVLARVGAVTRRVIEAAPHLRIVARHGVGVDSVDLDAATERGVVVTTAGSLNAAAVAEYTFGLLLTLVRKVREADRLMRAGGWDRRPLTGVELEGRTLGIVGVGAIGGRVARQGLAFGMQVIGCDPAYSEPPVPGMRLGSLEEVLAAADILTLHPRLNPTTFRMIDAVALAALHPGAIVVNTSRGEVVDEGALTASLQAGHLAGAALDVFAEEPLAPESPLREMENVVLSPHVAGQTQDAMVQVAHSAAQAILDDLAGRRPEFVYNPEVYQVRAAKGLFQEPVLLIR